MMTEHLSSILKGMGPALANHLWQSTIFTAIVGLLTMLLRKHHARIRFSFWLAASIKFLVPFSLLVTLGGLLPKPQQAATSSRAPLYSAIEVAGQPFSVSSATTNGPAIPPESLLQHLSAQLPFVLAGVWLLGAFVVFLIWVLRWRQVAAVLQRASPIQQGREIRLLRSLEERAGRHGRMTLRLSSERMEPGVFGIVRTVLIWPEQLSERLDEEQMAAILAHEMTHQQRRDNLAAAIHMLVEILFWFHPMVWWMERRMVEERERACDEAVVRFGSSPEAYAEGLLKACRFCVESPLVCVSGITGADLSRRVRSIMAIRVIHQLGIKGNLLLVVAVAALIAGPVTFGIVSAAQTTVGQTDIAQSPSVSAWHTVAGDYAASTTEPLTFEIASVKPNHSGETSFSSGFLPGGDGYSAENISLLYLIRTAYGLYNVPDEEFEGIPKWARTERFDIVAKVNAADMTEMHKITRAQRGMMLQTLLADRFQLRVHFRSKELPVFALVIAKNGPKLEAAKPSAGAVEGSKVAGDHKQGAGSLRIAPGQLVGQGSDMWALKALLSQIVGRTVLDKTGLTDNYNFELNWTPEENRAVSDGPTQNADDSRGPSIFTALQEQLGLKLESQKGPVEVLVIDQAQQPSLN
jgi:bla regulator protein BlaR1